MASKRAQQIAAAVIAPEVNKDYIAGIENGAADSTDKSENSSDCERKVIRTVYLNCESTEYEASAVFITATLASFGQ